MQFISDINKYKENVTYKCTQKAIFNDEPEEQMDWVQA